MLLCGALVLLKAEVTYKVLFCSVSARERDARRFIMRTCRKLETLDLDRWVMSCQIPFFYPWMMSVRNRTIVTPLSTCTQCLGFSI